MFFTNKFVGKLDESCVHKHAPRHLISVGVNVFRCERWNKMRWNAFIVGRQSMGKGKREIFTWWRTLGNDKKKWERFPFRIYLDSCRGKLNVKESFPSSPFTFVTSFMMNVLLTWHRLIHNFLNLTQVGEIKRKNLLKEKSSSWIKHEPSFYFFSCWRRVIISSIEMSVILLLFIKQL